ncbi:MAG: hypothetical protein K9L64_00100 [Candidatus Izimaplasma sp.]|nr:hypothetical protein [Candidatus Izimaplasma bacterium]
MKKFLVGILMLIAVVSFASCNNNALQKEVYEFVPELSMVDVYGENAIFIDYDNQVFTMGDNSYGQLSDGTLEESETFVNITDNFALETGDYIISVALGDAFGAALSNNGRVFTWGNNIYGKLGIEEVNYINIPVDITDNFALETRDKIVYLALGKDNGAVISLNGEVFTWGINSYGQLGDGNSLIPWEEVSPEASNITDNFNLDIDEFVIKIIIGKNHAIALTNNSRVFTWGSNESGQMGTNDYEASLLPVDITEEINLGEKEDIIDIAIGYDHSGVLTDLGRLYVFGDNTYGQLGLGNEIKEVKLPEEISENITTTESITRIKFGHNSSAVITGENVYVFGNNDSGQLGIGNNSSVYSPTQIDLSFISEGQVVNYIVAEELTLLVTDTYDLYVYKDYTWHLE